MSDHNERAFLKDKFKDFDVTSTNATKKAVMSKIQKKSRTKRFFIIFFLSAFVLAICTITTYHLLNNIDTDEVLNTKTENSKESNNKKANSSSIKVDLNTDKKQIGTNKDKTLTSNKINNKATQSIPKQFNLKSNALIVEKKEQQRSLIHEKIKLNTASPSIRGLKEEKINQTILNNKKKSNRADGNKTNNDSSIKNLNIKTIPFPEFVEQYSKLLKTDSNIPTTKENKWIVGLTFSYNNLRSNNLKNLPDNDNPQFSNPNNSLGELSTNQNMFKVSSIMNLELSVIKKLKNSFYLESGIRYTSLYSFTPDKKMQDHLLGIPLKIAYSIPLKSRWAIDLSAGINYNLSILRSEKNSEGNSNDT